MLALLAVAACDKGKETSPEPASSVITLANTFGSCPNLDTCERGCDAGDGDLCRRLGVTYQFGEKVTKDEPRATAYFEKGCALGNPAACVAAGQMYEYHHGVAKDDAKAAGFYERACGAGFAAGCYNWAIMLENGRGVPRDVGRAAEQYAVACREGAKAGCEKAASLGSHVEDGG
jgi:TPR repeat protein